MRQEGLGLGNFDSIRTELHRTGHGHGDRVLA